MKNTLLHKCNNIMILNMWRQVFDFIICLCAFFKKTNMENKFYLQNENNNTDYMGYNADYYHDNNQTFELQDGSHYECAGCRRSINYNRQTTYACNGKEFCSTYCRKKFSRENLSEQPYDMPIIHAIIQPHHEMNHI